MMNGMLRGTGMSSMNGMTIGCVLVGAVSGIEALAPISYLRSK